MRPTGRAYGLLAVGAVGAVLCAALGSLTAARIGAVVLLVPVVGLAWAVLSRGLSRPRRVVRRLAPPIWQVGETAQVEVSIDAGRPMWSSLIEQVPQSLRRRRISVRRYEVSPSQRGVVELGPAQLRRTDPLGVVRWTQPAGEATRVTVRPATPALRQEVRTLTTSAGGSGTVGAPQRALDDLVVREYRRGDDLRRVHWRSSAHHGELMVRQDETTGTPAVQVLLLPSDAADEVTELAVSLAGSICVTLLRTERAVELVTLVGGHVVHVEASDPAEVLDLLAVAAADPERVMEAIEAVSGWDRAPLMAVLDRPDEAVVAALASLGHRGRAHAVILGEPGSADTALQPHRHGPSDALRRAGWLVASSRGDEPVPRVWARLAAESVA